LAAENAAEAVAEDVVEKADVTFADYPFDEAILEDVSAAGYLVPTPIQAACIPHVLAGKDVIGLAQTGTGKTAAFALPIIQRVAKKPEMAALVLAPTRELAQQIAAMFNELGRAAGIRVATVVGGIPIAEDFRVLEAWPNVLVATPGRLIDHIQRRTVVFSDIEVVVVDEADRMYDMGFIPQVNRIIMELPTRRQTLMFTATMPPQVETIARQHLRRPVRIQVANAVPPARAEQKLYHLREEDKMALLMNLLRKSVGRVLVFARTKRKVESLARAVYARQRDVARLHSDREQAARDAALAGFREGRYRILIATDIASRGLDVADIEHVINYDFPGAAEDYVHRIGRTARVGASGIATSFVTDADRPCLKRLERLIKSSLTLMPVGTAGKQVEKGEEPRTTRGTKGGSRRRRRRGGRSRRRRAAQSGATS